MIEKFLEYIRYEKKYSEHTVTAYQKDLTDFQSFCKTELEVLDITSITYQVVRGWIVYLSNQEISNRSINRKCTALKSFYNYLYKIGEIKKNPMSLHKSLKIQKQVLTPFSEMEVEEAISTSSEEATDFEFLRNKLVINLLYVTGIRRSELIHLKFKDIDTKKAEIKVLGKRNKERFIPLVTSIIDEIREYLEVRSSLGFESEYFFITAKGDKMYPTLVYRIINSYFSKVSSKVKKSPHVLRHSFATDLINNGADLNSVKELLGHTSLAATQVYTHNTLEKIKQVYNQAHPRSAKKLKKK